MMSISSEVQRLCIQRHVLGLVLRVVRSVRSGNGSIDARKVSGLRPTDEMVFRGELFFQTVSVSGQAAGALREESTLHQARVSTERDRVVRPGRLEGFIDQPQDAEVGNSSSGRSLSRL